MIFPYIIINSFGHVVAGFVSYREAHAFKHSGKPGDYTIKHQSITKTKQ